MTRPGDDKLIQYEPEPPLLDVYPDDDKLPAQELVNTETGEVIELPTYDEALALTESIKSDLEVATGSFISAAAKLEIAMEKQAWRSLSRTSWGEYCKLDLHVGEGWASEMIRVYRLQVQFPETLPRLLEMGVSNARLVATNIPYDKKTKTFVATKDMVDRKLAVGETNTWRGARDSFRDDDGNGPEPKHERKYPTIVCPLCGATLTVTRATDVLSGKPRRNP